jgi:hypothetical protein
MKYLYCGASWVYDKEVLYYSNTYRRFQKFLSDTTKYSNNAAQHLTRAIVK